MAPVTVDTTEWTDEDFDLEFPPGSAKRQEQEREYPRPEPVGQSGADVDSEEYREFLAYKAERAKAAKNGD